MPVYFAITEQSRCVKIGFTAGAARGRLAKMQTDNHERLTIIRWLEGDEATEAAIQSRYFHQRLHGDWFAFCPSMMGELGAVDLPIPRPVVRLPALMERDDDLDRLFQIRGAVKRVADGLGISTAAVSQWKRVPKDRVEQVATILEVEPERLRPDLYPAQDARQHGEAA